MQRRHMLRQRASGGHARLGDRHGQQHPRRHAAFLAAFAGRKAMWWIYFSFTAQAASEAISHAKDPGAVARAAYT
ncbi:hypothetical protein [Caulobacter sp. DWR2-3-1b2]|uniref:hypothetical protein n=1 Tax=unclassified Caulobacter TaxID=2648921 RepID=UPI003CF3C10C